MKLFYLFLTSKQYTITLLYQLKISRLSLKELIMLKKVLICVFYFTLFSPLSVIAAEGTVSNNGVDYQYYPLEPDIITNYVKAGKTIGYVRISAELLVNSSANFATVERHSPLIRDRIITILGEQNEKEIKSAAERESIRLRCLLEINDVVAAVAGTRPVQDLFFTKFLYQ